MIWMQKSVPPMSAKSYGRNAAAVPLIGTRVGYAGRSGNSEGSAIVAIHVPGSDRRDHEIVVELTDRVSFAGFDFDIAGHTLTDSDARDIPLRRSEFDLLACFVRSPGRVLSRDHLLDAVAGRVSASFDRSIDVLVSRLRRKIEEDPKSPSLIVTVPGTGYKFTGRPSVPRVVPGAAHIGAGEMTTGKPRIAVLAFKNTGDDPDQEYFSDGISDDITTELSCDRSLFVIARTSSFTYKGRAVDVKVVAQDLGVRYVLEGSVRGDATRVRISAQLIDAESNTHIWAERYDRDLADIFAVQSEIARAVAIAIAPAVAGAEQQRAMRKPPGSLDAWGAYQRGLWHLGQGNAEDNTLAESYFQQAIDLDPAFAPGYSGLANAVDRSAIAFRTRDFTEAVRLAESLSRRAIALDDADAEAHAGLSNRLTSRGDHHGAREEAERALALNPNLANVYGALGVALTYSGRAKEGADALEECVRRDPRSPTRQTRLRQIAIAHYLARDYTAAAEAAHRAIRALPDRSHGYVWLAAALGQLDRIDEANEALKKALTIDSSELDLNVRNRAAWMRPEDHAHKIEGLRKAGWVE
jgi:TolB-like protein/Tfp pilus assembly protein PilF